MTIRAGCVRTQLARDCTQGRQRNYGWSHLENLMELLCACFLSVSVIELVQTPQNTVFHCVTILSVQHEMTRHGSKRYNRAALRRGNCKGNAALVST